MPILISWLPASAFARSASARRAGALAEAVSRRILREVAMNEGSGGLGAVSVGISEPIVLIILVVAGGWSGGVRRVEAVEADSGGDRGLIAGLICGFRL